MYLFALDSFDSKLSVSDFGHKLTVFLVNFPFEFTIVQLTAIARKYLKFLYQLGECVYYFRGVGGKLVANTKTFLKRIFYTFVVCRLSPIF